MSQLQRELSQHRFVVTTEIAPPKGVDLSAALAKASALQGITAVNVTDNQGGNMRLSPLVLAARLLEAGVEPILQLTCRDRNRLALQADLLGAAALGVENVLLLSGDHMRFGDHPQAKAVFDLDSVQLLQAVSHLNLGRDMADRKLQGAPSFFAGAAVSPGAEPFELMFQKYRKKVEGGARFFQTQAIFAEDKLRRFMDAARPLGIPVLLGVLLLKNAATARFLNANIPGVQVPPELVERLEQAADPLAAGVAIARQQVALAREICQGVHLMSLGQEELIPAMLT
ncbi:MAG: methylenetetrahydrofolate reductase [Desulfuromonadales bacterium]